MAIFITWAIGALSLSWEFIKTTWILLIFIIIESSFGDQVSEHEDDINFAGGIRRSFEDGESAVTLPKVI
jgi:hypothetical protein